MPNECTKNEDALKIFRKEKVMTINRLVNLLNCCKRTVKRRLIQWHTYRSYNHNGRYYVLSDIPKFDKNGLWGYKGIFFSKNGNLRQTILTLVNNSSVGLTVTEIANLVKIPVSSFMSQDRSLEQLRRGKVAGRYVYFSSDETIYTKQKQERDDDDTRIKLTNLPTDAEAVIILVERIKHPDLSVKQLSMRLNKKEHRIKGEIIRNLFEYHGIQKKTVDML